MRRWLITREIFFPMLGLNEAVLRIIVVLVVAGIPFAVAGAWFLNFDDAPETSAAGTATRMGLDVLVALVLAAALLGSAVFVYFGDELAQEVRLDKLADTFDQPRVAGTQIPERSVLRSLNAARE